MTLGSLFDGAGGFPLAGALAGLTPVWASEIEPFPIRVTTKRFPDMKHLGDITKINGAKIEPVDIITFGSPCQDLSLANSVRKGLDGERSGLFREAVRIIKEMRESTNGIYPAFIVWENVVGAFSSNGGEDFRQVLEEIAGIADGAIHITRPDSGKWAKAGEIVGNSADGVSYSLAWRVYDAQYWGVPQRRRRIYLVADFAGERAGHIQFERESVFGDFAESETAREKAAGETGHCASESSEHNYVIPIDLRQAVKNSERGDNCGMGIGEDGQPAFTVTSNQPHGIFVAGFNGYKSVTGSICYNEERSPCIEANMPPNVLKHTIYSLSSKASNSWKSENPRSGCYETEQSRTIDTHGGDPTCNQGGNIVMAVYENHQQDDRITECGGTAPTVAAKYGTGGNNTPLVTYQNITGALCARDYKGIGSQYVKEDKLIMDVNYIIHRLTPLECCRLQGFPDFWCDGLATPEPSEDEIDWWSGVFEIYGKPKTRNQIKKWLKNPYSDSAMYKMWGNSLAIPCAYTVLAGIAEELRKNN